MLLSVFEDKIFAFSLKNLFLTVSLGVGSGGCCWMEEKVVESRSKGRCRGEGRGFAEEYFITIPPMLFDVMSTKEAVTYLARLLLMLWDYRARDRYNLLS
jgi:hypothetical protein